MIFPTLKVARQRVDPGEITAAVSSIEGQHTATFRAEEKLKPDRMLCSPLSFYFFLYRHLRLLIFCSCVFSLEQAGFTCIGYFTELNMLYWSS